MVTKTKEPEKQIKAKMSGSDKWKDWGKCQGKDVKNNSNNSAGFLYFVAFVGALIYNLQAAVGFGAVVTGILKAIVWPAYIVYKLLENFYGVVG